MLASTCSGHQCSVWRHREMYSTDEITFTFPVVPGWCRQQVQQGKRAHHDTCQRLEASLLDPHWALLCSQRWSAYMFEDRFGIYRTQSLILPVEAFECQMTSKCFSCILESWLIGFKWITFIEEKYWHAKTDPRSSPLSGLNWCHFLFIPLSNILKIYGLFSICCIFKNPHSLAF